jgi:hypothetical protein
MKTSSKLLIGILAISFLIGISSIVYRLFIWQPEAIWDESPDKIIIRSDPGCIEMDIDYIPTVQIWGDGRIVWTEYNIAGERTVWEGYLTHAELKQLVDQFISIDFFRFWNGYNEMCLGKFLTVELSTTTSVRRRMNSEITHFFEIYNFLTTGAGTFGEVIIPEQGYLYVYPVEETGLPADTEASYIWPDNEFGYSLQELHDQMGNGKSISGEEIRFAWEIVNSPISVVESNGKVFWIGIIVPGINQ